MNWQNHWYKYKNAYVFWGGVILLESGIYLCNLISTYDFIKWNFVGWGSIFVFIGAVIALQKGML